MIIIGTLSNNDLHSDTKDGADWKMNFDFTWESFDNLFFIYYFFLVRDIKTAPSAAPSQLPSQVQAPGPLFNPREIQPGKEDALIPQGKLSTFLTGFLNELPFLYTAGNAGNYIWSQFF